MAEEVGRHYTGELGERYGGWQQEGAEVGARIDAFKWAGHVSPGDTVVDFGCGGGAVLAGLTAARRIGIEVNPPAREAAAARGLEVAASPGELPDATADVVISNHALEHTLAPLAELRELHRILKPAGRLVLWLPLDDWRTQRAPDPGDINHHLYTWSPMLLANLLSEAGFEVRESRVVAHAWPQQHHILWRVLPEPAFHAVARAWARLRRHRQVHAVAVKPA